MPVEWKQREISGSELQAGGVRLSTTDQRDRGCGWVWHAQVPCSYGVETFGQKGGYATEDEAKAAALAFVRDYCSEVLAAISEPPAIASAVAAATRELSARLIERMIDDHKSPDARVALAIAASNVRRGRFLTDKEKLLNLAKSIEEDIPGETEEERAENVRFAADIRRAVGAAP